MKLKFEPLGKYVHLVDERNTQMATSSVLGISIDKYFMPSVANVIGTDLSNYKMLRNGRFACNPMHVGRDGRLPVARYIGEAPAIVSPAYFMFEIIDAEEINPEYLMLCFRNPSFDRMCWFRTDASVRGGITWEDVCALTIPVPSITEQRRIVHDYLVFSDRINILQQTNSVLIDVGLTLFKSYFGTEDKQLSPTSLYDLAQYVNGTSFDEEEYVTTGLPIIKIAELKDGITSATQYFDGSKDSKYYVENEDILFSWSGNPDTSIDAFIWTHGSGILNQHTFRMICTYGKPFTFFMLKYCKPEFIKAAHGKQTTGLGHVTVKDLKQLTLPFNPDIAKSFNAKAMPVFKMLYLNLQQINTLKCLLMQTLKRINQRGE